MQAHGLVSRFPLQLTQARSRLSSHADAIWYDSLMEISRRDLCAIFSVAASMAVLPLESQTTQTLANSQVFPFDKLVVHQAPNGMQMRPVLNGRLPTGELLEVHETLLPAGAMPHAPHHHPHSELWLVREGTVELTVQGEAQPVGPGGVGFAASNQEHSIKNVGNGPAQYFVVAIGSGAA
jgi:mannose-6-phosphate isomerase-like protein (cupin superfamily)